MIRLIIISFIFVIFLNVFDKVDASIEAKREGVLVGYHMP
jgi:hypothetical protein